MADVSSYFDMDGLYCGPESPEEPGCPTCYASLDWVTCDACGGEGDSDLYDEDPFYYDEGDTEDCSRCDGFGGWYRCLSEHEGQRCWLPSELPAA